MQLTVMNDYCELIISWDRRETAPPPCDFKVIRGTGYSGDTILNSRMKHSSVQEIIKYGVPRIRIGPQTLKGPFTIVEGTARLVALYLNCVHKKTSPLCLDEIDIVLGLSACKWSFS